MGKQHQFRPAMVDALEERQLLSNVFSPSSILQNFESAFGIHSSKQNPRPSITVGALGDSYTDEYRFYPPDQSHARNWMEILASTRKGSITFGPFTTQTRGEPRDQGFAFNWARWGATSSDMVQNQLPGLTQQVKTGQVKFAWIFVGGNDFLYYLQGVQNGSIPASQALSALADVEQQAAGNITKAVNTLLAANPHVRLVVATVPDVAELPAVKSAATTPATQAIVSATSQAIGQYNSVIEGLASGNGRIALVDLAGQSAQLAANPSGTYTVGRTTINLTAPGDNYNDFFLADGIHIGTIGQGIIANDFINAIDSQFGAKVKPIPLQQIINFARSVQRQTRHGQGPP